MFRILKKILAEKYDKSLILNGENFLWITLLLSYSQTYPANSKQPFVSIFFVGESGNRYVVNSMGTPFDREKNTKEYPRTSIGF